jgi:RNA polymerase sigma factor (sigma-70 family)
LAEFLLRDIAGGVIPVDAHPNLPSDDQLATLPDIICEKIAGSLRRMGANTQDIEDMAGYAVLRVVPWLKLWDWEHVIRYAIVCAKHKWIDEVRRRAGKESLLNEMDDEQEDEGEVNRKLVDKNAEHDPELAQQTHEDHECLYESFKEAGLTADEQRVLELFYLDAYESNEIAVVMQRNLNWVYKAKSRALQKLNRWRLQKLL